MYELRLRKHWQRLQTYAVKFRKPYVCIFFHVGLVRTQCMFQMVYNCRVLRMPRVTWTSKWQEPVKASLPYRLEKCSHPYTLSLTQGYFLWLRMLFYLQLDTKNIPGIPFHVFRDAVMKSRGISHYPTQPHCSGSVSVFSQMLD